MNFRKFFQVYFRAALINRLSFSLLDEVAPTQSSM